MKVATMRRPRRFDKPQPDTSAAEEQLESLRRISRELNQVAGYFESLGMDTQSENLDKAGELVGMTKNTLEDLLGFEPTPDDL